MICKFTSQYSSSYYHYLNQTPVNILFSKISAQTQVYGNTKYNIGSKNTQLKFSNNKKGETFLNKKSTQNINELYKGHELNTSVETKANLVKKLLVLDIDETIVFTSLGKNPGQFHFSGNVKTAEGNNTIFVLIRPGLTKFLSEMKKYYDIYIFTASTKEYADIILNNVDPYHLISKAFYCDSCVQRGNKIIKNLQRLQRDLKDIIIIDNNPISYTFQKTNGIPIPSWYGDQSDTLFDQLENILLFLSSVKDVREFIPLFVKQDKICFIEINKLVKNMKNNSSINTPSDLDNILSVDGDITKIYEVNERKELTLKTIQDYPTIIASQKNIFNNEEKLINKLTSKLSNENESKSRNKSIFNKIAYPHLDNIKKNSEQKNLQEDRNNVYIPIRSIKLYPENRFSVDTKIHILDKDLCRVESQKEKVNKPINLINFSPSNCIRGRNLPSERNKKIVSEEFHADINKIHQILKCKTLEDVRKGISIK